MTNQYPEKDEDTQPVRVKAEEQPASSTAGLPTWAAYALALLGVVYILNPTAGILELLPDNLPIVGNLDEGVAFAMIWSGVSRFLEKRRKKS